MQLRPLNLNDRCLSFALRRASRAVSQILDRQLVALNLRSTQLHLLIGIDEKKNKSLTEIAAYLVMDRTTLTRNLKPLEKAGLIEQTTLSDKRLRSYVLTKKGEQIVQQAQPFWEINNQQLQAALGVKIMATMIEQLNQIINKCRHIV